MNKVSFIVSLIIVIILSSCGGLREKLLAPPEEIEIPEGSLVAICEKDDVTYKHIYQNDGIYQYFIDNVLQDDDEMDIIQEQAFLHGESMSNYLIEEYGIDGCDISDFTSAK